MCLPYTTLNSYTTFLEQRASNNFPDILRNFVRMRQRWFPGRFSYGLGTRLGVAVLPSRFSLARGLATLVYFVCCKGEHATVEPPNKGQVGT